MTDTALLTHWWVKKDKLGPSEIVYTAYTDEIIERLGGQRAIEVDRRRKEKNWRTKVATRPAWAELRNILQRRGLEWGYNDVFDTHRRIKCGEDTARFVHDNLAALAIEAKHNVKFEVTYGLRYDYGMFASGPGPMFRCVANVEPCIRIWPNE